MLASGLLIFSRPLLSDAYVVIGCVVTACVVTGCVFRLSLPVLSLPVLSLAVLCVGGAGAGPGLTGCAA